MDANGREWTRMEFDLGGQVLKSKFVVAERFALRRETRESFYFHSLWFEILTNSTTVFGSRQALNPKNQTSTLKI